MNSSPEIRTSDYSSFSLQIRQTGFSRFPDEGYDRIVFTNGCFDVLHRGHLEVLTHARDLAGARGAVVVGLNSDESVTRLKGPSRPVMSEEDRALLLIHLRVVDHVIVFTEDTPLDLIRSLGPDVIVKGGDYSSSSVIGHEYAMVSVCKYLEGRSTTSFLEKVRNG